MTNPSISLSKKVVELELSNKELKEKFSLYQEAAERTQCNLRNFENLLRSYIETSLDLKKQLEQKIQENIILEKKIQDLKTQLASKKYTTYSDLEDEDFDLNGFDLDTDLDSEGEVSKSVNNIELETKDISSQIEIAAYHQS